MTSEHLLIRLSRKWVASSPMCGRLRLHNHQNTVEGETVRLHWEEAKCTACRSCMIVCSERHTGSSSLTRARIRIDVDFLGSDLKARYCHQCKKASCAQACPEEAIRLHSDTGVWLVDEERCTGCGRCVEACPYHAVELGPDSAHATKCDLCGGKVWCVQSCPPAALSVRDRREAISDGR